MKTTGAFGNTANNKQAQRRRAFQVKRRQRIAFLLRRENAGPNNEQAK